MLKVRMSRIVLVMCGVAFAMSACSRPADDAVSSVSADAAGLLQYIPADTPYVFATPEPMADDVLDSIEPHVDAILAAYKKIMLLSLAGIEKKMEGNQEAAERFSVVAAEFSELMSIGGMRAAGFARRARSAFYGVGLVPVLRVELSDKDAFEAFISRLEEKGGDPIPVASLDGQTYRYVGNEDVRLILAVIDDYLVAAFVPTVLSDEQLAAVLGTALPAQDIASAGSLAAIAKAYDFESHALGFVDVQRLVATFLDDQSGVNAEVLALMEHDDADLSAVCRAEIRDMAGIMPRIVAGYTEISVDKFSSRMVFEFREDIASGLATLAAAVPGLGKDHGGLFSIGMSTDLLAARDFYTARLDAMEAKPYECELLSDLQNGVAQGREVLNQPIPPLAYGYKGFLAVVDAVEGFDLATKQPPSNIDMRLLVAIDNAEGLLAMGSMFSPELAALNLQADGKPVKLVIPQLASMSDSVYVAMTESALGIAIGADAVSGLGDLLAAPAGAPPPMLNMHVDAASYYGFVADAMRAGNTDGESAEMTAEMKEAVTEILTEIGGWLNRMSFDITFTERGLEIVSVVTLVE